MNPVAEPPFGAASADARAWLEQRRDSLRLLQRLMVRPPKELVLEARTNEGTRRALAWAQSAALALAPSVLMLRPEVYELPAELLRERQDAAQPATNEARGTP